MDWNTLRYSLQKVTCEWDRKPVADELPSPTADQEENREALERTMRRAWRWYHETAYWRERAKGLAEDQPPTL